MNSSNQQIKDWIIAKVLTLGYESDRYGNYKQITENGVYRYKFGEMSYRFEKLVDTTPKSWMRIGGNRYGRVVMED